MSSALESIRPMHVLPGGSRLSGAKDVWQCPVQVGVGTDIAFIKLLAPYQLVREVVCALVAQAVGLPVIQPGVATLENAEIDTDIRFAFASLAVDTQLAPRLRDDTVLRSQLSRWPSLRSAIAFDEWIANSDRTIDNLLFRGASDFVLVDHGEAIPSGMSVDALTVNQLARLAYEDVSRDEEHASLQHVRSAASQFDQVDFAQIKVASHAPWWGGEDMLNECCRFLEDRRLHLDDLVTELFGKQQTLQFRDPTKQIGGGE